MFQVYLKHIYMKYICFRYTWNPTY